MQQQCFSLKKTLPSFVQLGTLDLNNHYLVDCIMLQSSPSWFAWNVKVVGNFSIFLLVIHVFFKLHILKDFSSCPCLSKFFLHPQPLCFIFYLLALFKKGFLCKQFCKSDLKLPELFGFELLLEDLLEWLFVFDGAFEHVSPSFVSFSQECTFPLKFFLHKNHFTYFIKPSITIVDLLFFLYCLHSLCAATTLQNVVKLCQLFFSSNFILAWIKQAFSGTTYSSENCLTTTYPWSETIYIPFLLMIVSSLFVLCQNCFGFFELHCCLSRSNSCWCIPPRRFDIHLCVSSGRSLALPWCISTDAVCGRSVPTISSALATSCFS